MSDRWCMCVVSYGYGGLGGARIEVVDSTHALQSQGFIACQEMPEHFRSVK